jgi:LacI family transcriptional regulator
MRRNFTIQKKSALPTLSQVARAAGVGTTTVSRVINGGDRVSAETLAKVKGVIQSLGYMPNHAARVLKGDRTKTIGLIVPSIADPFFSSCAEAAEATAQANDSLLIVTATHNDWRNEIENVNVLASHRVDGLIIAAGHSRSRSMAQLLDRLGIPVVAIDRPISGSKIASVVTNNFAASTLAVEHLIAHGRKHIACLTGESDLFTIRERIRGYSAAVQRAGFPIILETSVKNYDSALRALSRLLKSENPPDGLFTLKNSTTIYVFEVLQKLGIRVPDSMALLGFDDFRSSPDQRSAATGTRHRARRCGTVVRAASWKGGSPRC